MSFTPELGSWRYPQRFRFWCQKVLPLVYDDSLSYYEVLCKVVNYLNKTREDLAYFITNWSNPIAVSDYNEFTDKDHVYLYTGTQSGYLQYHWYYYDKTTEEWKDGGLYGSAVVDDELSPDSTNAVQNRVIYQALHNFKMPITNPDGIIRVAHSGAEDVAPANSEQGIIWAKGCGFDYAELDVRCAQDGFVICHNATTAGFAGYNNYTIRDTSVSLLTTQDIISGSYINLYPDMKMMSLEQAIIVCKRCHIEPQFELKDDDLTDAEIQLFYDTLMKYGIRYNCTVKSFYSANLDKVKYIDSSVRCEYIIEEDFTNNINLAYDHGFDSISLLISSVNVERVQRAHNFGLTVNCWTIRSQAEAKIAIDCGVDAITTSSNMYWTNGADMDYAIGVVRNIPIFNPMERDNILEGNFINRNYLGSTPLSGIYNTTFNGKYAITTGRIVGNGSGGDIIRFLIPANIRGAVQGWDSDGNKVYDSGWSTGDGLMHSFTSTGNCASYTITLNRTDTGYLNQRVLNDVYASINVRVT